MWRRWCAPSSETHVGDDRCRRWILEMSHVTRIMDGDPTAEARAWPMLRTGGGGVIEDDDVPGDHIHIHIHIKER
jgi:hypothetical protein